MKRIETITCPLLLLSLCTVIIHGSCVDDVIIPEEEPIGWIEIRIPNMVYYLDVLSLASNGHGTLLQGTVRNNNLWRSTDRGKTWYETDLGLNTGCDVTALLVKNGEKIFAGLSGGGIFISLDNGASWTQVNNHLTDLDIRSMTVNADGDIIAATDHGSIFRSTDDGGVWRLITEESIETPVRALATDSTGILYAGCLGQGVFISENGGESWTECSDGLLNLDVRCLAIHGAGYILAGTSGGDIYKSAGSGEQWMRIDGGAAETDINAIATDRSGTIWAGTSGDGIIRSTDGGDSWEMSNYGIQGLEVLSLLCENDILLAGTAYYGAFRSIDGGANWASPTEYVSDRFDPRRANSFAIDSSGDYYLLSGRDILKSSDEGRTWARACHGLSDYYTPDKELLCLEISPDGSLFAGTREGIFISTDYGNRWTRADTFSAYPPYVVALDAAADGTIFGLTPAGVLRSGADGASWEYVYEKPTARCISTGDESYVYLGTSYGILRSADRGDTWEQVTDSIRVESIVADRRGNVFAAYVRWILRSCDRGDNWTTISLLNIMIPDRPVIATTPGGEIVIFMNYRGDMLISYDRFTTGTVIGTPSYFPIPYFGPDGHLFITSSSRIAIHRSDRPLF